MTILVTNNFFIL